MTVEDTNIKVNISGEILVQKSLLVQNASDNGYIATSNVINTVTNQIQQESNLQNLNYSKMNVFCDKLLQNSLLQNLNLMNKFCNSWYFRDQWTINNVMDNLGSAYRQYTKITVLPSLGVFAKDVLYNSSWIFEKGNFSETNGYRLKPGVYVYDWKSDKTMNILWEGDKLQVKPYTIYYIKSLPQQQANSQDATVQECIVLMLCQNIQDNSFCIYYQNHYIYSNQDSVSQFNNDYVVYKQVNINIDSRKKDGQPTNYWTVNETYLCDISDVALLEPIQKMNQFVRFSSPGDICQWGYYNSTETQPSSNMMYIFKLSEQYYIVYNVIIEPASEEPLITQMQIEKIAEPTVYNVENIYVSNE